jgi:hypothetical protein
MSEGLRTQLQKLPIWIPISSPFHVQCPLNTHIHPPTHTHTHTHARALARTRACAHAHTHTHTHTNARAVMQLIGMLIQNLDCGYVRFLSNPLLSIFINNFITRRYVVSVTGKTFKWTTCTQGKKSISHLFELKYFSFQRFGSAQGTGHLLQLCQFHLTWFSLLCCRADKQKKTPLLLWITYVHNTS